MKISDIFKGFKNFLLRGNVIDLAVAVVVGGAFNAIVNAFVKDLITPLIGSFGGKPDFSSLSFSINNSAFLIGDFLNAVLSFVIMAGVVYFFIVMPMNKLSEKVKKDEKTAPILEKICPECLSSIPVKAKRCKFCTAVQIEK